MLGRGLQVQCLVPLQVEAFDRNIPVQDLDQGHPPGPEDPIGVDQGRDRGIIVGGDQSLALGREVADTAIGEGTRGQGHDPDPGQGHVRDTGDPDRGQGLIQGQGQDQGAGGLFCAVEAVLSVRQ